MLRKALAFTFALAIQAGEANATIINDVDWSSIEFGYRNFYGGEDNDYLRTYDASTHVYTDRSLGQSTVRAFPTSGEESFSFESIDARISAVVTNSGEMLSGAFTAFGSSSALGIEPDTLFLAGSVIAHSWEIDANSPKNYACDSFPSLSCPLGPVLVTHTIVRIDYVDPRFVWGDYLHLNRRGYLLLPAVVDHPDLFTSDFVGVRSPFSTYYTEVVSVPEPGALSLLATGLVALWTMRRRRIAKGAVIA